MLKTCPGSISILFMHWEHGHTGILQFFNTRCMYPAYRFCHRRLIADSLIDDRSYESWPPQKHTIVSHHATSQRWYHTIFICEHKLKNKWNGERVFTETEFIEDATLPFAYTRSPIEERMWRKTCAALSHQRLAPRPLGLAGHQDRWCDCLVSTQKISRGQGSDINPSPTTIQRV